MLPLGLRVQDKLERVIDKHMRSLGMWYTLHLHGMATKANLGASKVSLSSISSQELWGQSGRLTDGSEVG